MRVSRGGRVITLGRAETRIWQSSGPDGYALRDHVYDVATAWTRRHHRSVEIYACARSGGWTADVIPYDADMDPAGEVTP